MIILAIETSCDDTCVAILKVNLTGSPPEGVRENYPRLSGISSLKNFLNKGQGRVKILSNIVSSQIKIHQEYGGVHPGLAKREHLRNLLPVLTRALKQSKLLKKFQIQKSNLKQNLLSHEILHKQANSKFQTLKKILKREKCLFENLKIFFRKYQKPDIDMIAITIGPGLEPCLWTGVNFAKALACFWDLPIAPVNHIEAHIVANWLLPVGNELKTQNSKLKTIEFPAICLVASGGHTQLILMKNFSKYKILGETRDDAAGECFDKTARILGLGYPGGPAIAAEAKKLQTAPHVGTSYKLQAKLPRPMIYSKDYDFSFSGLKTAVLYEHKTHSEKINPRHPGCIFGTCSGKQKACPVKFVPQLFNRVNFCFPSLRLKIKKTKEYIGKMAQEIQQAIIDVLIKKTMNATREYKAKTIILGGGVTANEELRKQFKLSVKRQASSAKILIPSKKFSIDNAAMIGITAYLQRPKGKTKNWKKIKADANLRLK
ncbi:tRNA (adenosine(37)-N6)-threonylcarbamoyltransferase complex transferase subunit TsaD [Patescibacteria group bacterium]|nr:tRNA (adenosine(37)-N6)-threonylcarbamoyltransferase complex transferase subunit TsaD [Patescibacteria group bacterium]